MEKIKQSPKTHWKIPKCLTFLLWGHEEKKKKNAEGKKWKKKEIEDKRLPKLDWRSSANPNAPNPHLHIS